ncbi:hypothetical protein [Nostoc sp.]|uniref:hypothetical protein n=1 Tax=Nostoc sp. TaxID=1180 RepID=UPI002FF59369
MSSAKTATNAKFSQARIELKSYGSLIYILRGQNQQGFEVEVQVTPGGTLIQVDEQIEMSGVPETAVKAFKKWAPNDPLISTWRSTRLGELFYQFVIRNFFLNLNVSTTLYLRLRSDKRYFITGQKYAKYRKNQVIIYTFIPNYLCNIS